MVSLRTLEVAAVRTRIRRLLDAALVVECPMCGALVDHVCTLGDAPLLEPHADRVRAGEWHRRQLAWIGGAA